MSTKVLATKVEKAINLLNFQMQPNLSRRQRQLVVDRVCKKYNIDKEYVKKVYGLRDDCRVKN